MPSSLLKAYSAAVAIKLVDREGLARQIFQHHLLALDKVLSLRNVQNAMRKSPQPVIRV